MSSSVDFEQEQEQISVEGRSSNRITGSVQITGAAQKSDARLERYRFLAKNTPVEQRGDVKKMNKEGRRMLKDWADLRKKATRGA